MFLAAAMADGDQEIHTESDKIAVAQALLSGGSDPDMTDNDGQTPLHLAINLRFHAMALILLENGANANLYEDKVCLQTFM